MAEYIFRHLAELSGCADRFDVSSAAVSYEEEGNPVYPPARRKLAEEGIPFGDHHAHRITPQEYREADYVIIMDESNRRLPDRWGTADAEGPSDDGICRRGQGGCRSMVYRRFHPCI